MDTRSLIEICGGRALRMVFVTVAAVTGLWTTAMRADESSHTILFFGDSLTAGYGLDNPAAEAYPALIQAKLDAEHRPWKAINAGVSGETSAGGVRRIDWALRQPVDIFFLALGANDGLRGIDPDVTRQNLEAILSRVHAKYPDAKLIVAGMEMPPTMGANYTQRYRAVFAQVAKDAHATLLPFLLLGVAGRSELNQGDAVHPTAAGQLVVAENVWKIIRPLL